MSKKQQYSVLLDTSFVIRLLSLGDPLHDNALGYYKYFLDNHIEMKISTISIAEYCVKGEVSELPLANLKIIPFNFDHAVVAGQYAQTLYRAKNNGTLSIDNRLIIPNDTKLFAQASKDKDVKYFVTSDTKSAAAIKTISDINSVTFFHLDIHTHLLTYNLAHYFNKKEILSDLFFAINSYYDRLPFTTIGLRAVFDGCAVSGGAFASGECVA